MNKTEGLPSGALNTMPLGLWGYHLPACSQSLLRDVSIASTGRNWGRIYPP